MQTQVPARKLGDRTRDLVLTAALLAIGAGLVAYGTPLATWSCKRSASVACGVNQKATATYTGNALTGKCVVTCE